MSLDGAMLSQIRDEILGLAQDARIDRIAQPSRDDLILHLRWKGGRKPLLISANANSPRMHFTENVPENPQNPPMFCMLLRKHLQGARLAGIRQLDMDRVVYLDFDGYNEFGDPVTVVLAVEIMGKHSNIILIDADGKIMDSIKRVDISTSSVRQVLPGITYHQPPPQNKSNILTAEVSGIISELKGLANMEIWRGIISVLEGFSPLPCREIAFKAVGEIDTQISDVTDSQWQELAIQLTAVKQLLKTNSGTPTIVIDEDGRFRDFSFMEIHQYGSLAKTQTFESYSKMLDYYFTQRDNIERMRQRSSSLINTMSNISKRVERRIAAQKRELLESQNRDELRVIGDILTANIHQLEKGMSHTELANFYDEDYQNISIDLDPRKTPAQNAQHYYTLYRKADNAEKKLTKLVVEGEQEQIYVDSVLESLTRAETESDLETINQELVDSGYVKKSKAKGRKKINRQEPHTFISSDGFTIYAGRNNHQNDRLTLKDSNSDDIWLHTQNIPSAHVVIVHAGREIPQSTIVEAAVITAYYSQAKNSGKVPVDYTIIKNVRKPSGAKPGMVIYDNYNTITVDPNQQMVNSLKK